MCVVLLAISRCAHSTLGVEPEVRVMLQEKGGYTAQQLTYVVLLRQQLDNSKQTNEKLKHTVTDLREKLLASKRWVSYNCFRVEESVVS